MKSAIFLAEGFETCEALITVDLFRRANKEIDMVSITDDYVVKSSQNVLIQADKLFKDICLSDYEVLILPGGKLGTQNLENFTPLTKGIQEHYESGKMVCAICAAPSIFGHLGILENKHFTCFPGFEEDGFHGTYEHKLAVKDQNVITGRGMGATVEFAFLILRQWLDEEQMKQLQFGIQYEHSF